MSLVPWVPDVYLLYGAGLVGLWGVTFFIYRRRKNAQAAVVKPSGHRDRTVDSLERIAGALEAFAGGGEPSGLSGRLLKLADQYEGMAKMGLTSGIPPADVAKSIRNAVTNA